MNLRDRSLAVAGLILATSVACSAQPDPRAMSAYQRTKDFSGTYAAYSWNWVRGADGSRMDGWSAEFHQGSLHRVEVPMRRIIADCAAATGSMLDLKTGRITTGPDIAGAACGINSNRDLGSLAYITSLATPHGQLDVIAVDDGDTQSRYALSSTGIIIASEIVGTAENKFCLQSVPLEINEEVPDEDMFSVASLHRSFVPASLQRQPRRTVDIYWTSGANCR